MNPIFFARDWQHLRLAVLYLLRSHIDEINELILVRKLSRVSEKVTIVYILKSLPQVSKNVKTALENQTNANFTLNFVTQRLLNAEPLLL